MPTSNQSPASTAWLELFPLCESVCELSWQNTAVSHEETEEKRGNQDAQSTEEQRNWGREQEENT